MEKAAAYLNNTMSVVLILQLFLHLVVIFLCTAQVVEATVVRAAVYTL